MTTQFAEVSGTRLVSGSMTIPWRGAWSCDLVLEKEVELPSSGLAITIGELVASGAKFRGAPYAGRTGVRVIGGKGGWAKTLAARGYFNDAGVKLSLVLGDAARDAGESIKVDADRSLGSHFARLERPAERVLNLLAPTWWIDLDGTTRVGSRATTPIASAFELVSFDRAKGIAVIASEHLGDWLPGRTFQTSRADGTFTVGGVTHKFAGGTIRTEVLVATGAPEDRFKAALAELVRELLPTEPYRGTWEYVVVKAENSKCDARPASSSLGLPELQSVPMDASIAGSAGKLKPGSVVFVTFLNGDPGKPRVIGKDGSDPQEIHHKATLVKINNGVQGAARVGDAVIAGPFAGTVTTGSATTRIG